MVDGEKLEDRIRLRAKELEKATDHELLAYNAACLETIVLTVQVAGLTTPIEAAISIKLEEVKRELRFLGDLMGNRPTPVYAIDYMPILSGMASNLSRIVKKLGADEPWAGRGG